MLLLCAVALCAVGVDVRRGRGPKGGDVSNKGLRAVAEAGATRRGWGRGVSRRDRLGEKQKERPAVGLSSWSWAESNRRPNN